MEHVRSLSLSDDVSIAARARLLPAMGAPGRRTGRETALLFQMLICLLAADRQKSSSFISIRMRSPPHVLPEFAPEPAGLIDSCDELCHPMRSVGRYVQALNDAVGRMFINPTDRAIDREEVDLRGARGARNRVGCTRLCAIRKSYLD